MGAFIGALLLVGLFAGLMIGCIVLRALIISQIWGWYIVPFFGVNPLPLIFAFGISCFVSLFTLSTTGINADTYAEERLTDIEKLKPGLTAILGILMIWGIAAIGRYWFPDKYVDPTPPAIEQVAE